MERNPNLSGKGFLKDLDFTKNVLVMFAVCHGRTKEEVERFLQYNLFNGYKYAKGNLEDLCDRNGRIIDNVFGAFLGFVR